MIYQDKSFASDKTLMEDLPKTWNLLLHLQMKDWNSTPLLTKSKVLINWQMLDAFHCHCWKWCSWVICRFAQFSTEIVPQQPSRTMKSGVRTKQAHQSWEHLRLDLLFTKRLTDPLTVTKIHTTPSSVEIWILPNFLVLEHELCQKIFRRICITAIQNLLTVRIGV